MRNLTIWIVGLALLGNGLAMLAAPETWYHMVPTVPDTGPFNPHFVRDVACAYLVSGGALLLLLYRPDTWLAAMAMAVFQCLHALTHIWDTLAGRETLGHFGMDVILVGVPALAMLWLAWPPHRSMPGT